MVCRATEPPLSTYPRRMAGRSWPPSATRLTDPPTRPRRFASAVAAVLVGEEYGALRRSSTGKMFGSRTCAYVRASRTQNGPNAASATRTMIR